MKKKFVFIAVLVLLCALLSGCYRADVNVKVKKSGKFTVTEQVLASKSYYDMDGSKNISANTVYKNLKKEVKDNFKKSKKSLKFKKIKKTIKGEKYYGYKVSGIKSSEFKDSIKSYKKNGRVYVVLDMTDLADSNGEDMTAEEYAETMGLLQLGGMSTKMKFTFPKKPKTTFGSVKGRTVTIDLLKYIQQNPNGGKIVISCKK